MKSRKIVDYIILNGRLPEENIFNRVISKIKEYEDNIAKSKAAIESKKIKLERFQFLSKEFKTLNKLEVGKEYKLLSRKEFSEWSALANRNEYPSGEKAKTNNNRNQHTFDHPLHKFPYYEEGAIIFGNTLDVLENKNYEDFKRSIQVISDELKKLEEHLETNKKEIADYKIKLKKLLDNQDPILNMNVRTNFENEVLELVKKGYEPLGGVSVSYGSSYQTMVKYEID